MKKKSNNQCNDATGYDMKLVFIKIFHFLTDVGVGLKLSRMIRTPANNPLSSSSNPTNQSTVKNTTNITNPAQSNVSTV